MHQLLINNVINKLKVFDVSIYLVGSLAYDGYHRNWSDIDLVVISNKRSNDLSNVIGGIVTEISTVYKFKIGGGGDSPLDIFLINQDEYINIINSNKYYTEKYRLIAFSMEVIAYGRLLFGENKSDWLNQHLQLLSEEIINNSLIHSSLQRINLYHSLFTPLKDVYGNLDLYAPHKKYKVIPLLYIMMVKDLIWLKIKKFANKLEAEKLYYNLYREFNIEVNMVFSIRTNWNKQANQLDKLSFLANRLPIFINWYLQQINGRFKIDEMYFIRGRKLWHYREEDINKVKVFLEDFHLKEDNYNSYINFINSKELTFIEKNNEIVSIVLYRLSNKILEVDYFFSKDNFCYKILDYYIYQRALEKKQKSIKLDYSIKKKELKDGFVWSKDFNI